MFYQPEFDIHNFPVDQLPSRRYPFWGFIDFWWDF